MRLADAASIEGGLPRGIRSLRDPLGTSKIFQDISKFCQNLMTYLSTEQNNGIAGELFADASKNGQAELQLPGPQA
jgi:hypothetical protein